MTDAAGPALGPLTFEETRELVEAASPDIALRLDAAEAAASKGRFLVAKRAIAPGEVILAEHPLFSGSSDAKQSRQAYESHFADLADAGAGEELWADDDRMHPCSPLVDCLASIILAKKHALCGRGDDPDAEAGRAASALRVRKLLSLCRAGVANPVPEDCAQDLVGVLKPDLRALTSEPEVYHFLHALSSNRFGSADSQLDLMFAGSMFEHSCFPNCFVAGVWRSEVSAKPREYRALRDIKEGEALSIDYLLMPDSYLGAAGRAEKLAGWGFTCTCPRCTAMPEMTRAFVCQACSTPELCPERPGPDARLVCRSCGEAADAAYAARCLAAEAALLRPHAAAEGAGAEEAAEDGADAGAGAGQDLDLVGRFHFTAFLVRWQEMHEGFLGLEVEREEEEQGDAERLLNYVEAVEDVIEGLSRLYGPQLHPHMLELHHVMAVVETGNLEAQRKHLENEAAVLRRFYPEEAQKQDDEIMWMVQNRGPVGSEAPPHPLFGMPGAGLGGLDPAPVAAFAGSDFAGLSAMD